jgi:RNA polymerase sigma-70 factor (family 1)
LNFEQDSPALLDFHVFVVLKKVNAQLIALRNHDQQLYEEARLIALLADDSEYAFQLLFDRYRNRIYQTAIRYLKSPMLAQEVVQDVFLKLWFERKNIRQDLPLEAWLFTIARNNLLNRLKKLASEWKALKSLKYKNDQHPSPNTSEDKLQESQYNQLLQEALHTLPEQQHRVFLLSRNEHLTYAQIGELLDISPLTVKTHMSRALEAIRSFFLSRGELFIFVLSLIGYN